MSSPVILTLMTICFLAFGYLGVPVPFALMAGVFVGATLADVSLAAILQKVFDGVDNEALLAIPVLPPGGRADELGQRRGARRQPVARAGGPHPRRIVAGGHGLQHVLFRDVGIDDRGCRRHEPRARARR